jgi:hypothetical protein
LCTTRHEYCAFWHPHCIPTWWLRSWNSNMLWFKGFTSLGEKSKVYWLLKNLYMLKFRKPFNMNFHCHFTNKTIEHFAIFHIFLPLNNQIVEHFVIEQNELIRLQPLNKWKNKRKTFTNELASMIDQMKKPFGNENEFL